MFPEELGFVEVGLALLGFGVQETGYLRGLEAVLVFQGQAGLEQAVADFIDAVKRAGTRTGLGLVADDLVSKAVEAIKKAAYTGRIGDGKIFISSIEQAIRIRTGESGTDAL